MKRIQQLLTGILIINFAFFLGNCKSKNDNRDKIVIDFETELKLLLNKDKTITGKEYKDYLVGINEMTVPRDFFDSAKKVESATEFKKSDLFKSIWEKKSIINKKRAQDDTEEIIEPPITAGDNTNPTKIDYYQINPNSKFMNNLINETKNDKVKSFFKEIQKIGEISPAIISNALIELNDFEDESVKKYIVVQFYFDFIFMMNRMHSIN